MYCTSCGNPIESSAHFCTNCGQPQQTSSSQRAPGTPPGHCPNCSAQLADSMAFCSNCGLQIPSRPVHAERISSPAGDTADQAGDSGILSWKMVLLGILSGLLLTALAIPVVLFLRTRTSNPAEDASGDRETNTTALNTATPVPLNNLTSITETPSTTAVPTPTSTPTFSVIPWVEDPVDSLYLGTFSECLQEDPLWGCTHTAVTFPSDRDVLFSSGWCTSDDQTLEDNLRVMTLELNVDGVDISLDNTSVNILYSNSQVCQRNRAILMGWSTGEHHIHWTRTFAEDIDDGFDSYPAGSYSSDYQINVVDQTQAELEEIYGTDEGVQVELLDGNALEFSQPPTLIAYANDEHSNPPADVQLAPFCLNNCFRHYQWLGMTMPGESYDVIYTGVTDTLGVQFWGDQGDGIAHVYVNGDLLWEGSTAGTDGNYPGGAFVKYLQITGLNPVTNHILRVETDAEGGAVTMFFFGFGPAQP